MLQMVGNRALRYGVIGAGAAVADGLQWVLDQGGGMPGLPLRTGIV